MPCTKCNADFNFFTWKMKCGECTDKFCLKCLTMHDRVLYCEKCVILMKRPPDRQKLMELKPKDLQDYLKKHNISTHGLVEKQELVELFCNKHIPVKHKKTSEKLTANFGCSLPNLRENSTLGDLWDSLGGDSLFQSSNGKCRTTTAANTQANSDHPRPPPRRRSPRNSPTASTTSQFEASSVNQSSSFTSPPAQPPPGNSTSRTEESQHPPSTSYGASSESEWVFVTTQGSSDDMPHIKTPEGSPVAPKCPKLSELESLEDLNQLTAKQLKTLLRLNRVDYKGCLEKKELLDKATALWSDNKKQRQDLPDDVEHLCKLCMDAPLDCVLLECGHIATCIDCGKKLAECPICRQYVSRVVRTFKA
ncbi:hypothetical protein WA026_012229 [Henosepilachna vigintioctopunctata]|uniref:RING-type domain-containing protein n=1 Tax=Henosepilachna vigintioctopunctata TaxID=420089 RepID=A0AAW1VDJ9_9CUCU